MNTLYQKHDRKIYLEIQVKKNWTIIRPYITFSENRLQLGVLEKEEWLYRALKGRTIVFSKDIASKLTTLTYGYDVAKGIVAILRKEEALEQTFQITVKESHKWGKIVQTYLSTLEKHLGYKPRCKLLALNSFLEVRPFVYQIKYDRLYNREFDNAAISKFIPIDEFRPTINGVIECLNDFN